MLTIVEDEAIYQAGTLAKQFLEENPDLTT